MNEEKIISGMIGVFVSFVASMIDIFGQVNVVLTGLMIIDFITGCMVSVNEGSWRYSIGIKGLIKKTYIILLIGATYMMSSVVDGLEYIGIGVASAFIVMEFISIVNNGHKLNVGIPKVITDIITLLKERGEKQHD